MKLEMVQPHTQSTQELSLRTDPIGPGDALREGNKVEETGFSGILEKTALAASDKEHEAVAKAEALAAGKSDDLHGTMITMKEADISMKLVGSVRDKLLDAFHELWRINV